MQKNKVLNLGNSSTKKPFCTIDDALEMVPRLEKLTAILKELGERKHPLAVRKGSVGRTVKAQTSAQVHGSTSTYFLDIERAKTGSKYLRITQSRKADEDAFARSSICIFPQDAEELGKLVTEMLKQMT